MKKTTRIIDITDSIFNNNCYYEMENACKNQLSFFTDSHISKIIKYDSNTHEILNKYFFKGYKLDNEGADYLFKKTFFNRFLIREIKYQTFDVFISQLISCIIMYENILNYYYSNIENYLSNVQKTNNNSNQENETNTRSLYSTLPQNNLNLDLNDDYLEYGDNNTISKNKNITKGETENVLKSYDYIVMTNLINKNVVNIILNKIDKKCFLQIW